MLKYTRAMMLRTKMQISQVLSITRVVSLFTAILPPLCQILTQSGVFLRNLIFVICGLGFAVFTLVADAKKEEITKKQRKRAKKAVDAVKFAANLYALFVLGYGIYCANEAPTLLSLLSLVPIAFSILIFIIMYIVEKIVNAQLELFVDAVEMDFRPLIESWKKVEKFVHTVANDGVEINTEIQVSPKNRQILEETAVVLEGENAKKKAKKQIEKKKKQEEGTRLAKAFFKGLFTYGRRSNEAETPAIEVSEEAPVISAPTETPVPEITAAKKKNPLEFLTPKKKKVPEQIAEHSEESSPEEALPRV